MLIYTENNISSLKDNSRETAENHCTVGSVSTLPSKGEILVQMFFY